MGKLRAVKGDVYVYMLLPVWIRGNNLKKHDEILISSTRVVRTSTQIQFDL
jgi:hypothetical protein